MSDVAMQDTVEKNEYIEHKITVHCLSINENMAHHGTSDVV